jgi:hypothetical protein
MAGFAMAQLGVEPARMEKCIPALDGWLRSARKQVDYLARPKGSRAKRQ